MVCRTEWDKKSTLHRANRQPAHRRDRPQYRPRNVSGNGRADSNPTAQTGTLYPASTVTQNGSLGCRFLSLAVEKLTTCGQFFFDTCRFAGTFAQVVQLRTTHCTATFHFNFSDDGGVGLESTFHAFASGDFTHDEAGVQTAIAFASNVSAFSFGHEIKQLENAEFLTLSFRDA